MAQILTFNATDGNVGDYYVNTAGVTFTIESKTSDGYNVWDNDKSSNTSSATDLKVEQNCTDIQQLQQNYSTLQTLYNALLVIPDSRVICRDNAVQSQPPTDGSVNPEFPNPVDDDSAIVVLSDGTVEIWEYDSFWSKSKTQSFGGSTFDSTAIQSQIDVLQAWVDSQSGNTTGSSFFCRVGTPTQDSPPSSAETGITGTPDAGFQFMIILPDDTIQVWQYTTNQWELKQTIDFATITALLSLRSSACRLNNVAGTAPTTTEAGTTPPADYVFTVYLANGTQEIWLYNGTGWILKQTIPLSTGGTADIGQGQVSKDATTGVISITGTTTAGAVTTIDIKPADLSLVRNQAACVDELHFCGVATGITFAIKLEDSFVSEDIASIDLTCIKDCSYVYDCAASVYYRKIAGSLVAVSGTPEIARFYGFMDARKFACKLEESGAVYCHNYVQTYEHKELCISVCVGQCTDIIWPAIDTRNATSFTVKWGDGTTDTYADGSEPEHTYATEFTGGIEFCFDKCADTDFTIAAAVSDASYVDGCGCTS